MSQYFLTWSLLFYSKVPLSRFSSAFLSLSSRPDILGVVYLFLGFALFEFYALLLLIFPKLDEDIRTYLLPQLFNCVQVEHELLRDRTGLRVDSMKFMLVIRQLLRFDFVFSMSLFSPA